MLILNWNKNKINFRKGDYMFTFIVGTCVGVFGYKYYTKKNKK